MNDCLVEDTYLDLAMKYYVSNVQFFGVNTDIYLTCKFIQMK